MTTTQLKNTHSNSDYGSYSLWREASYRLKKNTMAMLGFWTLLALFAIAACTPWLAPYAYENQNLALGASPPSAQHLLGTDIHGRDLLTRLMYGSRVSLLVGFAATAVSLVIGILWGTIAGYIGGRIDAVMMRIVDILYALPFMIFIIFINGGFWPKLPVTLFSHWLG